MLACGPTNSHNPLTMVRGPPPEQVILGLSRHGGACNPPPCLQVEEGSGHDIEQLVTEF